MPVEEELKPEDWEYFAEGAANMILKSRLPQYSGTLLRVRKYVEGSPSTVRVNEFYQKNVIPILGDYYVGTRLVNLSQGFVKTINEREPAETQRNDTPLDDAEEHAFLMESAFDSNLKTNTVKIKSSLLTLCSTPDNGELQEVVLEFKPKWLLKSPNSGEQSIRCRTCALAFKRGKKPGICPLDLVSDDYDIVFRSFERYLDGASEYVPNKFPLADIVATALFRSPLLGKLKKLQQLDKRGILGYNNTGEELDEDFLVATAARDCTMFVSVRCKLDVKTGKESDKCVNVGGKEFVVGLKLADIDLKNPSKAKREYWAGIERSLLEDGWYTNTDLPSCRALS